MNEVGFSLNMKHVLMNRLGRVMALRATACRGFYLLTTRPDTDTAEGRSQDRYRRAVLSGLVLIVARFINVGTGLAMIPLALKYLKADQFGIWMVFVGISAILHFMCLGVPESLQNKLTECEASSDRETPSGLVANALIISVGVALFFLILTFSVFPWISWSSVMKASTPEGHAQLLPTAQSVMVALSFLLLSRVIHQIYTAYQKAYWPNVWLALGRLAGFISVLLCIWMGQPLWMMAGLYMGLPFLAVILGGGHLFWVMPWVIPRWSKIRWSSMRALLGTGSLVLLAGIAYALGTQSPQWVIASQISADAVNPFVVTWRALGITSILVMPLVGSLWPAYSDAFHRQDWVWVRRALRRTEWLTGGVYGLAIVFWLLIARWLIGVWTGDPQVIPSWSLLIAVNIWCVAGGFHITYDAFLNGLGRFKGRAIYGMILAVVGIVAGLSCARSLGATGVVWLITIAWLIKVWMMAMESHRCIHKESKVLQEARC